MKVMVIGGDGDLSLDSSSFIIEIPRHIISYDTAHRQCIRILFDCGVNAFTYIRENNLDIDYVFISHTHFNCIGGLESLITYNHCMKNKPTKIIAYKEVKEDLEYILKDLPYVYNNGSLHKIDMFTINDFSQLNNELIFHKSSFLKGNHVIKPNYGIIVRNEKRMKALIITGDTKASFNIARKIQELAIINGYETYIFHDFSLTDNPYENFHCCESDFNHFYGEFKDHPNIKWFKYHNEEFNKNYKDKTIVI